MTQVEWKLPASTSLHINAYNQALISIFTLHPFLSSN
jgi:hypothetical protein